MHGTVWYGGSTTSGQINDHVQYSVLDTYLCIKLKTIIIDCNACWFYRCFGPKCGGCGEKVHYQDFVRKARDKVYHLRCFTCSLCSKQLSTGEVLYLQPGDEGFVCKDHYLNKGKTKKMRLLLYIVMCFWERHFINFEDEKKGQPSGSREKS